VGTITIENFRIVKMSGLSGGAASIYSVYLDDSDKTAFEKFLAENVANHEEELISIISRLKSMGTVTGAREQYFKHNEGKPGDLVCALYDEPGRLLRLYCIRLGNALVILGGGGPKSVRAWQDDPKLSREATKIIEISALIGERMQQREICLSQDGMELTGNLNFNFYEE
jgi:hypothetical protein